MFGVYCVPINCCRMELSIFWCIVPVTLAAIGVIFLSPTEAYKSSSSDLVYTVPGQFNHSYKLNVSHTAPVSILYKQSHLQVTTFFLLHQWLSYLS